MGYTINHGNDVTNIFTNISLTPICDVIMMVTRSWKRSFRGHSIIAPSLASNVYNKYSVAGVSYTSTPNFAKFRQILLSQISENFWPKIILTWQSRLPKYIIQSNRFFVRLKKLCWNIFGFRRSIHLSNFQFKNVSFIQWLPTFGTSIFLKVLPHSVKCTVQIFEIV